MSDHELINPGSPKPVYMQVADIITARIESGELAPDAKLPSERDMGAQFGVAYDTVRRATAVLRERGLIVTVVGKGTYVVARQE